MRISDKLAAKRTFSYEIFPPRGEMSLVEARSVSNELCRDSPDWISVTYSAGGTGNSQNTVAIAGDIETRLSTTALAHLTCMGATRSDVDSFVDSIRAAGIENVLALRGDRILGREPVDFAYSTQLISYLKDKGLCVGAACYPEGHVECEDLGLSIRHLKEKQDAGADFLVTQLFFENDCFYRFREAADKAGVTIPITVGIMPFTSDSQIKRMAFNCGASIPSKVIKRLVAAGGDDEAMRRAGIVYACEQLVDLAAHGAQGLHIYTMNKPEIGHAIHDALLECGYLHA